ncbi:hypothetical protein BD413DRAFT_191766 [Trametes elegans]|nr:hypothetical protein BD413DRAFT_191766 [Trametes elegans]
MIHHVPQGPARTSLPPRHPHSLPPAPPSVSALRFAPPPSPCSYPCARTPFFVRVSVPPSPSSLPRRRLARAAHGRFTSHALTLTLTRSRADPSRTVLAYTIADFSQVPANASTRTCGARLDPSPRYIPRPHGVRSESVAPTRDAVGSIPCEVGRTTRRRRPMGRTSWMEVYPRQDR